MRKKFLALSLAVIVSAAQVMTVSASKQEKLQQQQAAQAETSAQLDNAKAEIDDLETKKNQITGEIDDLDAQLVVTMASVENLKNEIAEKQTEIEDTQKKLSDAQAEEDEQYEQMKKRIKFLYESGGDNGWAALHFSVPTEGLRNLVYTPHIYVVDLNIDGKIVNAILKDIQFHPVTDAILHVDFYQIDEAKPIVMEVPVQLEGLAEGVRAGGKLALQLRKLKVKALYNVIPERLVVDVTSLGLGKTVKVGELSYEGLELINAKEAVVCAVKLTRAARGAAATAGK